MLNNDQRAQIAADALAAHDTANPARRTRLDKAEAVARLVADLVHWCNGWGIDASDALAKGLAMGKREAAQPWYTQHSDLDA